MKQIVLPLLVSLILSYPLLAQETLPAKAFNAKMKSTPDAVVLDVRTPSEVELGTIPDAINVDFKSPDFSSKITSLDKDKTYFVYCAKGGRSIKAVDEMKKLGFKKLVNLEEGYAGWVESGLPTTKKDE